MKYWLLIGALLSVLAWGGGGMGTAQAQTATPPISAPPVSTPPDTAPPPAPTPGGSTILCPGSGVTARVAECSKRTVVTATNAYYKTVNAGLAGAVTAAMTLAVALFGILTLTGTITPNRDTTILLLKIGVITAFTANIGYFFETFLGAMDELLQVVADAVPVRATAVCQGDGGGYIVWQRMDCMLNRIIGITPGVFLSAGIFGLITAALFSQKVGLAIAALGIMVVVMLLLAVARALYVFIMAYTGLGLLVVFAPIFLTMLLFRHTKPMFDKWAKMCVGFALQPFFLFAYLMVMLTAYDITVFSGQNSLYRTLAGDEALSPDFRLNDWLISNNVYVDSFQFNTMLDVNPGEVGAPEQTAYFGIPGQMTEYLEKAGEQIAKQSTVKVGLPIKVIDLKRLADLKSVREGATPPYTAGQMANFIILSLLSAALVGYVLFSLLGYIPAMGYDLAAGAASSINLSRGFSQVQNYASKIFSGPLGGGGGR